MSSITNDIQIAQQKLNDLKRLQELEQQQKLQLEQERFLLDEAAQAEKAEKERLQAYLTERLQLLELLKDFSSFETKREELNLQLKNLNTQENNQVAQLENVILQIGGIVQKLISKTWTKSPTEFQQAVVLEVSKLCSLPQARVSKILYR